jgi:hypothetical protein
LRIERYIHRSRIGKLIQVVYTPHALQIRILTIKLNGGTLDYEKNGYGGAVFVSIDYIYGNRIAGISPS